MIPTKVYIATAANSMRTDIPRYIPQDPVVRLKSDSLLDSDGITGANDDSTPYITRTPRKGRAQDIPMSICAKNI